MADNGCILVWVFYNSLIGSDDTRCRSFESRKDAEKFVKDKDIERYSIINKE